MRRREFVALIGGALAAPRALAQLPGTPPRIAFPVIPVQESLVHLTTAFEQGLRAEGYEPGKDVLIDYLSAGGRPERYAEVVQQAVRARPDIIIAGNNSNISGVKAATHDIPVVMVVGTNVLGNGYVASLARPGGNITGLTWDVGGEIIGKRIEFMAEMLPKLKRVARLYEPGLDKDFSDEINRAAGKFGASVVWIEVGEDLEAGFRAAARERADMLLVAVGSRMFARRKEVADLAIRYRLPATYPAIEIVDAGGLLAYAPPLENLYRRAAWYVSRILKGAKPADLPVERPTRLQLVINLKAAKAIGLRVPQSLLLRADRVIE